MMVTLSPLMIVVLSSVVKVDAEDGPKIVVKVIRDGGADVAIGVLVDPFPDPPPEPPPPEEPPSIVTLKDPFVVVGTLEEALPVMLAIVRLGLAPAV